MTPTSQHMTITHLLTTTAVLLTPVATGAQTVIRQGQVARDTVSLRDDDTLLVEEGGQLSVNDDAIKLRSPATDVIITNAGVIESVEEGGRAIDDARSPDEAGTITLNNLRSGIVRAQGDAFRIDDDVRIGRVVVNNDGLILSTLDGQALDFDDIVTARSDGPTVTINNSTTGVIKAENADGIRPGNGSVLNNAGLIFAGGPERESHDGIDFQDNAGTVNNLTGGIITGQRHGIDSKNDLVVFNARGATIIGGNGSGVGSDGDGRVVNYGTIIGDSQESANGDGDGVDLDGIGFVDNHGLIEGRGPRALIERVRPTTPTALRSPAVAAPSSIGRAVSCAPTILGSRSATARPSPTWD